MASDMTMAQSWERFREGTKKAADRCRMLANMYKSERCIETGDIFNGFATSLEQMLAKGTKIYNSRGLNRTDTLAALDRIMKTNAEVHEGK